MKRALLILGVAVGPLAAAGIAWSSEASNSGPPQIRVYGGGQWDNGAGTRRTISIGVTANPAGLDAHGSFRYAGAPPGFRGEVTCLSVAGITALVGGFVREPAALAGIDFVYAVTDNGPPASGADRAGFIDIGPELDTPPYPGLPADVPRTCPTAAGAQDNFGAFPLTGDVSIETP